MQNVTRWHDSVLYVHTMCLLCVSCARLEPLQAKNWALSRCCPRGPLGENIHPLHRGTFVERLEHHCHGGSLPVLAGRNVCHWWAWGSGSRICWYVSFLQFLRLDFSAWERVRPCCSISVAVSQCGVFSIWVHIFTGGRHFGGEHIQFPSFFFVGVSLFPYAYPRDISIEEFAPISIWWRNRSWLWALRKLLWFWGLQVLVEHWGSCGGGDSGDVCIICIPQWVHPHRGRRNSGYQAWNHPKSLATFATFATAICTTQVGQNRSRPLMCPGPWQLSKLYDGFEFWIRFFLFFRQVWARRLSQMVLARGALQWKLPVWSLNLVSFKEGTQLSFFWDEVRWSVCSFCLSMTLLVSKF